MSLVLLLRALWALQSPAGTETVVYFTPAEAPGLDTRALLDAVAVYTRDLRVVIETSAAVPTPRGETHAAATDFVRARGARIGFWCERELPRGNVALTTIDRAGRLETHPIDQALGDDADLYRGIALKLRSVLVATVGAEVLSAQTDGKTDGKTGAKTDASVATPAAAAITPGTPASNGGGADRDAPERPVFVVVGYRVSASSGDAPVRHAVAIEAGTHVGGVLELAVGSELGQRWRGSADAGRVEVLDIPVWVAARAVRSGARLTLGGGAFASVHALWATARASDGAEARSTNAGVAAGLEAIARVPLVGRVQGEARLYAEAGLPDTRYLVRDVPVLEVGTRVGLGIGLVLADPR